MAESSIKESPLTAHQSHAHSSQGGGSCGGFRCHPRGTQRDWDGEKEIQKEGEAERYLGEE